MSQPEVKSERQARLPASKVQEAYDAFGCHVVIHTPGSDPKPYNAYIFRFGVKPNKTDPSNTHAEVIKKENIADMVHVAAKDVGIKAVLKQIGMGLRSFESIVDDGSGSMDDTLIPEFVGDIPKIQAQEKAKTDAIFDALGVDSGKVNKDNLESFIQDIVNQAVAKVNAAKKDGGEN